MKKKVRETYTFFRLYKVLKMCYLLHYIADSSQTNGRHYGPKDCFLALLLDPTEQLVLVLRVLRKSIQGVLRTGHNKSNALVVVASNRVQR